MKGLLSALTKQLTWPQAEAELAATVALELIEKEQVKAIESQPASHLEMMARWQFGVALVIAKLLLESGRFSKEKETKAPKPHPQ